MDTTTKAKIKAGAKIGFGAIRIGGAIATATGHGLIGAFLKNHNMMMQAGRLAQIGLDGGTKMFDEGVEEWKRAK